MSLDFYLSAVREVDIFDRNITHNLGEMADKAGIYNALWRPDEHGFILAVDIIDTLEKGIADMEARPDFFKEFNPENGWGDYYGLLNFAQSVLEQCKQNPDAKIRVSR